MELPLHQHHRHRPQRVEGDRAAGDGDHLEHAAATEGRRHGEGGQQQRHREAGRGEEQDAADGRLQAWGRLLLHPHQRRRQPQLGRALADELDGEGDGEEPVVRRGQQPRQDHGDAGGEQLQAERAPDQHSHPAGRGYAQGPGFGRLGGLEALRLFLGDRYRSPVIGSREKTRSSGPVAESGRTWKRLVAPS